MIQDSTNTHRLKNHIAPKAKRLAGALKSKFGISLKEFNNALEGDLASAKKIGEMARQGRLSIERAPKLAEDYIQILEGTEAYNQAIADILTQAGRSAIAIDKSQASVMLANTEYGHQRRELAQQFSIDRNAENIRHRYQMNYDQIRGYVNAHLVSVDMNAALLEQSKRPEAKQIAADEQFERRQLDEALTKGKNARYDLIPHKDYTTGIRATVLKLKTALGF